MDPYTIKNLMYIRFFLKFFLGLILGLTVTLYIAQHNRALKQYITLYIQRIAQQHFKTYLKCDVHEVNLFSPRLVIHNLTLKPLTETHWSWGCETLTFKYSWLDLLMTRKIVAHITINNLTINTECTPPTCAIIPHFNSLLFAQGMFPLMLKRLTIKNGVLHAYTPNNSYSSTIIWDSKSKRIGSILKSTITITDGSYSTPTNNMATTIRSNIRINKMMGHKTSDLNSIQATGSFLLPCIYADNPTCFFSASVNDNSASCKISSADGNASIHPIEVRHVANTTTYTAHAHFPLAYIQNILPPQLRSNQLEGSCSLKMEGTTHHDAMALSGTCALAHIHHPHNAHTIDAAQLTFARTSNGTWSGTLYGHEENKYTVTGSWNAHEQPQHDQGHLSYTCTTKNQVTGSTATLSGSGTVHESILAINGTTHDHTYAIELMYQPTLRITKAMCCTNNGTRCFSLTGPLTGAPQLSSNISYSFLKNALLPDWLKNYVPGEGTISITGGIEPESRIITGTISLSDGTILLPNTRNPIKHLQGTLLADPKTKRLQLEDMMLTLHRGSISTKQARVTFDDTAIPSFIHIPLSVKNLFVGWKQDVFATVSGKITAHKKADEPLTLSGTAYIDRSSIKEGFFSQEFKNEILNTYTPRGNTPPINLNITVATRHPVSIKTPLLESNAHINLHVTGSTSHPHITGSVELNNGSIKFPYKPLNIIDGKIHFLPEKLNDPIVHFTARNTIKRYTISMYVSGSLHNHSITFESNPPLTDEQIGALLLVGSEKASLNIVAPALIVQNVQNSLLESSKPRSKIEQYIHGLLEPFKHIKIVPSFNDETGRSGLRGSIEIDVNDRLQACIQKNFSVPEDTRFDVDYSLTDDISIRGIKDERGDIGGEIEMRWKF